MGAIIAGSTNGRFPVQITPKLEVLGVLPNYACNLSCRHCYLEASRSGKFLQRHEWTRFFTSVLDEVRPSILTFAGKEPFLNARSAALLFDAVGIRDRVQRAGGPRTEIGAITNGTLLHEHFTAFESTPPDYVDISIDGLPDTHDEIRGQGVFARVHPNLTWLRSHFAGNVWLTHTLFEANVDAFPEFVRYYHRAYGIRCVSVGFYRPQWYTDQNLSLVYEHYARFAHRTLFELERLSLDAPTTVVVHIDSMPASHFDLFAAAGWTNSDAPLHAEEHVLANGLTVRFHKVALPIGLWRSARATPEGLWLAAEDVIRAKEYEQCAVARLADFDFDATRVYQAGLASGRLAELVGESEPLARALNLVPAHAS